MAELSPSGICLACCGAVRVLRNFGAQPLTNQLLTKPDDLSRVHPLILGLCQACGTVQLCDPCPNELARPSQPVLYNEPEGHLDALVDEIVKLPGVSNASRFGGLTYKESTTLERLRKRGYHDLTTLSPQGDFGISDDCAGLETIQARVTPDVAERVARRHAPFDVLLARHILEHAHNLTTFLQAIKRLVTPDGYVVFEVPNCTRVFESLDYSFLWEEHISYFTPTTLANTLRHHALDAVFTHTYPYPLEDALVTIARDRETAGETRQRDPNLLRRELERAERYERSFATVRRRWHETLTELRHEGQIALLGVGHLAVTFMNLLELDGIIDYACDDDPEKVGRWIPGTQLRVEPTDILLKHPIHLCLLAVATEWEPSVLARNQEFVRRGGRLASVFAASEYALSLHPAESPESLEM